MERSNQITPARVLKIILEGTMRDLQPLIMAAEKGGDFSELCAFAKLLQNVDTVALTESQRKRLGHFVRRVFSESAIGQLIEHAERLRRSYVQRSREAMLARTDREFARFDGVATLSA